MAPSSAKRKRPDRQLHDDGVGRPSPHRPENLGMAQRGDHNGGRGGRGGSGSRRQSRQGIPMEGVNSVPVTPRGSLAPPLQQSQGVPRSGTPAADISRTGTPVQRAATPAQPLVRQTAKAPPAPYAYEHVSDDVVASWPARGRQAVLDVANAADEDAVSAILQELVRSALDGRLDAAEAGAVVKDMIAAKQPGGDFAIQSLLLDSISLLDDADTTNPALLQTLASTEIDPELIRQQLDVPLLLNLHMVRSTFTQMKTRKTTNILYRQANFNLLREETEGYAKLMTEVFNIAEEASGNREISYDMAKDAFQRIKALVGAFDLDVGRVLDITLDIGANALVKAFGFIIKFYRCSSWWPDNGVPDNIKWEEEGLGAFPVWALPGSNSSGCTEEEKANLEVLKQSRDEKFWERVRGDGMEAFFRLGARKIVNFDDVAEMLATEVPATLNSKGKDANEDKRKRMDENRKYMLETRTLPPSGNSDAAQLLGFKLRFYASPARDVEDKLTDNLIHFTALLIKIGFVSLRDLYPHLHPPDEKMPEERKRLEQEKAEKEAKEKPGGGPNALVLASALTDDSLPVNRNLRDKARSGGATPKSDSKDDAPKDELPPPANQKILLLKALLALGALPEALHILGRFPWLLEVDTSLPPYLHRLVRHMLSKVAETVRPLADRSGLGDSGEQLVDTLAGPDGAMKFAPRPVKRSPMKWLSLEGLDESGAECRYYYTDWADSVPVCQTLDDVFLLCSTLLGYVGVKIGQDNALLCTLVRLAKKSLSEDSSDPNRARWLELMRRLLVPALSLCKHNPSTSEEVYELLMLFPITTRYNIYAEWFTGKTSRLPEIKAAFDFNRAETKEVLRRISNDNAKTQARALGKVSYSSPGVLITFMINQLESYSNMIPALVKCTEYFSRLAQDVLIWCLINALNGRGRDRMQADGMLTSPWLQALSQFVASIFSRYPDINPSPILQYLASELRVGDSTDLEMFEQMLAEMTGIRTDLEFNDNQVLAMAGGEQLQAQVVQQLGDFRHMRKSNARRLIKALAEPGLVGQTLVAIAQERQLYAHHESCKTMPLKVLGNNLDKIQLCFAQYLDVLRTFLKPNEFEGAVPDVVSLVAEFGLPPSVAFSICRVAIAHRMSEADEAKKLEGVGRRQGRLSNGKASANGDVDMQDSEAKNAADASTTAGQDEQAVGDATAMPAGSPQSNGVSPTEDSPWHPVLETIIERLKPVTGDLHERVNMPFFVTFWTLSQSDVVVYTSTYRTEIERLQAQVVEVGRDRTDRSSTAVHERERNKKALLEIQNKLRDELSSRINVYTKLSKRLSAQEKNHWFEKSRTKAALDARHLNLLQECFLPRAMMSSLDAHYSFLMLKMLHDKGAPGFSTLHLLTQMFRKQALAAIIFQCTALEAQHFGRFLNEVLKLIASWHAVKGTYEKEALGKQKLPGFVTKMDDPSKPETWSFMDYEMFRRTVFNWHAWLTGALQMCFESGEYMHIKNGIIVLKAVVKVFPALNFQGDKIIKLVETLSKEESRADLKLMALSLLAPLKKRKPEWIMPQNFRLNDPLKNGKPGSRSTSARPETPPKLSAVAAEFKPGAATQANGVGAVKEPLSAVEDGEVREEMQGAGKVADVLMKDAPAPKEAATVDKPAGSAAVKETVKTRTPEPRPASTAPATEPQTLVSKPPSLAPTAPRSQPQVNGSSRDETSRSASAQPAPSPASHDLPSRPETRVEPRAPHTSKPLPPPPVARPPDNRFQGREDHRFGRLDRPVTRELSPPRSRPLTPSGSLRGPAERPSRQDFPAMQRRDGSSPATHLRPHESRERANGSMGPPAEKPAFISSVVSAPEPQLTAKPAPITDVVAQAPAAETERVNPGRLALIQGGSGAPHGGPHSSQFAEQDRRREHDRGRVERAAPSHPARPDSRLNGRGQAPDLPHEPQSRREQPTDLVPSGPRNGRLGREMGPPMPQQESSYGRLSTPQDMPSGPKPPPNGPGGRNGRNFTAPAFSGRPSEVPMPSPSVSHPPESPVAPRPQPPRQASDHRNAGPPQNERPPPITPVSNPSAAPATEDYSEMHPSRRPQFQPPPIQTNIQAVQPENGSRNAQSPTSAPPSGPRGTGGRAPVGAPTGPAPISATTPTGPTSTVDRRNGNRQWQNINAHMTQAGSPVTGPRAQDVSFRGASTRPNGFQMASAATVPAPQAIASPMEPPQPRRQDVPARPEVPSTRPDAHVDVRQGAFQKPNEAEAQDGGRARHRDEERGERHRSSRNVSRDRRRDDEPPLRAQSGVMDNGREQRAPPAGMDNGREQRAPPGGMDNGRDQRGPPRDERRSADEQNRRDGPSRESRGHERGPRSEEARRPPPTDMSGAMSTGPPIAPLQWDRGHDGRGSRRDGPRDDGRRGGNGGGRPEDFRTGRREDERRDGGRGMAPRDEGMPAGAGRAKRPREDGGFEPSKRRSSGRPR
ncbi:hypothetical protein LTR08_006088 [Meristemomyces frigidus]|nr:hypothetical protein LTR08_006088 [Meristemomyces frigidus]